MADRPPVHSPAVETTAVIALLVLLVTGATTWHQSGRHIRDAGPATGIEIASLVPPGGALRLAALGHTEAVADLLWLSALSYFGANYHLADDPRWLDPHIDAIVTLDPQFRLVYVWAGAVIMYGTGITNATIMASNRVLERGIEMFPDDWEMHMMLGVNYYIELQSDDVAERAAWREQGARYLGRAGALPGAPSFLRVAGGTVLSRTGSWSQALASTPAAFLRESDPSALPSLRVQIESLLPPPSAEALLVQREMLRQLGLHRRWRLGFPAMATVVHPEPIYLFDPRAVAAPTYADTR